MPLDEDHKKETTLNDRLAAVGQLEAFDEAISRRDMAKLRASLVSVQIDEASVSALVQAVLDRARPVRAETARRFATSEWPQAYETLDRVRLPLLDGPDRATDRARVQMALVKLAAGQLEKLRWWVGQASVDWRDVLVAAGMANADWREVLAREGFAVPGDRGA